MGAFRLEPAGQPEDYRTFSVVRPRSTHSRPASCEEAGCVPFSAGWTTTLDVVAQPDLVAALRGAGRPFTEVPGDGARVQFVFAPGTPCFRASEHTVPLDVPSIFAVRGGDHRGNPMGTPTRTHVRPDDWVEEFALHQQAIADQVQRG